MKLESVVASQWKKLAVHIMQGQLLLPFYPSHMQARKHFFEKVQSNDGTAFVAYESKLPRLFFCVEQGQVINALVASTAEMSWSTFFQIIERFYKQRFQTESLFTFSEPLNIYLQECFVKHGYFSKGSTFVKKLTYKTALVLGGGGARGAYQIGVWQALKELQIPITLVTGTSVGALNGALILQDDFAAAKEMWEKITTEKILSFPVASNSAATFGGLLNQISAFTLAAIQSRGVSTQPLQQLISDTFSLKKMQQSSLDFYLAVTELPSMQEKTIHFSECSGQWQRWLLASASFFPAMAAARIDENYFVDGGYRNNIPVDIALAQGATECIVVDVKGPGITKSVKVPQETSISLLQTPWSMGNVLLFDGVRSTQNIQLGYLETMKKIGRKYLGYWYTFDESLASLKKFQQAFFSFLKKTYQIKIGSIFEQQDKIYKKMRRVYKDRVYAETIGLALLELLAKSNEISAAKLYTVQELIEQLQQKRQLKTTLTDTIGMISVQEWLRKYYDEYFLLSDKQQLLLLSNLLNVDIKEKQQRLIFLLDKLPVQTLQILMKEFIQQGVKE
ncbi:patatin-like phospholipase family protein [Erwinia sp. CPCC 100877]|nr:patatin-like phospholipase family protein [Erwinia sp. CPCC 100877]